MGQHKKTNTIDQYIDSLFLLACYAHIRVPLESIGVKMNQGLVLYIVDSDNEEIVLQCLQSYNSEKIRISGRKIPKFPNNKMVLLPYLSSYKDDIICEFLECEDYFPVVVVSGIFPESLEFCKNILVLEFGDIKNIPLDKKKTFKEFLLFTYEDIESRILKFLQKDVIIKQWKTFGGVQPPTLLGQALFAAAMAYYRFYVSRVATVVEGSTFLKCVQSEIIKQCMAGTSMREKLEVFYAVRNSIYEYFDRYSLRSLDIDSLTDEISMYLESDLLVLFDENYYYFTDSLFKKIMEKLLTKVSYVKIKKCLHHEGVLVCNATDGNYTIKKVLPVYGDSKRIRFLKFCRNKIDCDEKLSIAERGV